LPKPRFAYVAPYYGQAKDIDVSTRHASRSVGSLGNSGLSRYNFTDYQPFSDIPGACQMNTRQTLQQIAAERDWWSADAGALPRAGSLAPRDRGEMPASVFPARIAGSRPALRW
jgi:hypothetical protein